MIERRRSVDLAAWFGDRPWCKSSGVAFTVMRSMPNGYALLQNTFVDQQRQTNFPSTVLDNPGSVISHYQQRGSAFRIKNKFDNFGAILTLLNLFTLIPVYSD